MRYNLEMFLKLHANEKFTGKIVNTKCIYVYDIQIQAKVICGVGEELGCKGEC